MNKYTMIEMPFRAFMRPNLRKIELKFLSEICERIEKDGFLDENYFVDILPKFSEHDWTNHLNTLIEKEYYITGPRSIVDGKIVGRYVMFWDDEQHMAIYGKPSDRPPDDEHSVFRFKFPKELLYDERLDMDDLFILGLCFCYSEDAEQKFIRVDMIHPLIWYFKFPIETFKNKFARLVRLGYLSIDAEHTTISILPEFANIFISYSHKDTKYLEEMKRHFKPFEDKLSLWDDSKIKPGEVWEEEIDKALEEAVIAILLVSPDFFSSDIIIKKELPKLLTKQNEGLKVIALLLSPCIVEHFEELRKIQFVNSLNKPIIAMKKTERETVYLHTLGFVKMAIEDL